MTSTGVAMPYRAIMVLITLLFALSASAVPVFASDSIPGSARITDLHTYDNDLDSHDTSRNLSRTTVADGGSGAIGLRLADDSGPSPASTQRIVAPGAVGRTVGGRSRPMVVEGMVG